MKRKPRILVVGSLVMDLIVSTERFPGSGETVLGLDYHTASGGKGANQAVQAARLGAEVTMVGRVGQDDFGKNMVASVRDAGVNVRHVLETPDVCSAIGNVQLEKKGANTANRIIVVSGANMKLTAGDVAFLQTDIANYDMVVLQFEIPMEVNALVASYAYAANVPVMLNTAPSAPVDSDLLAHVSYISPNEHEAADLSGIPVVDEASAMQAIRSLLDKGVQNVLITRGGEGAVLGNAQETIISPSVYCANVVDPTAAGDSFAGAFCTAVAMGAPHRDALRFANYAAHITVSHLGAQPSLPTLAEVLALMRADKQNISCFDGLFEKEESL